MYLFQTLLSVNTMPQDLSNLQSAFVVAATLS